MRTGLMFEVEKAGSSMKETEKVALEYPRGWSPSLEETRGDYHSKQYMESLHVSPALVSENKNLGFSPADS
jgi:hypothetical protein